MENRMKIAQTLLLTVATAYSATSFALPSLQLGGDESDIWNYDFNEDEQTWVSAGTHSFDLFAYANCQAGITGCTNPNGDFAWDSAGATDRYAYLTVATMPDIGDVDGFDITINGATQVSRPVGPSTPVLQNPPPLPPPPARVRDKDRLGCHDRKIKQEKDDTRRPGAVKNTALKALKQYLRNS